MKILGIETSCDETGVSLLEATGTLPNISFKVLGDSLYSQIKIHAEYGGVFPMMAKRAHALNLVGLFTKTLKDAGEYIEEATTISETTIEQVKTILAREDGMADELLKLVAGIRRPNIGALAVTHGPGLEPALWVGVNFARALSTIWNIPIIPTNHMQGHIFATAMDTEGKLHVTNFPIISLLISGGHTELVLMKDWLSAEIVGRTRDDAVGEAFDKVARILGLPYPGGPQISRLASIHREKGANQNIWKLPKPMIHSHDLDFSFSGLKTAVLYAVKSHGELSEDDKETLAREFEDTATEVLVAKTLTAVRQYSAEAITIGGGVSCNIAIRKAFTEMGERENIRVLLPDPKLSTDNSVMIAIAGYINLSAGAPTKVGSDEIKAQGNLKLN
jgi:N6-L-threonylcarbamoyladenine synthase